MNVYDIQDLQNVETLSTHVDLQSIFQLIILILIFHMYYNLYSEKYKIKQKYK